MAWVKDGRQLIEKLGRNSPCPCGSGKKYKRCCLNEFRHRPQVEDAIDRETRQFEGLCETMISDHLAEYQFKCFPDDVMSIALEALLPEDGLPDYVDVAFFTQRFIVPWFFFSWVPHRRFGLADFDGEMTLAMNYLKSHQDTLNEQERGFIEGASGPPYSFYGVQKVNQDGQVQFEDALLGSSHRVYERENAHLMKKGDLFFGRVCVLGGREYLFGTAPFVIPSSFNKSIQALKAQLTEVNAKQALTPSILRDSFHSDVLPCFYDIIRTMR